MGLTDFDQVIEFAYEINRRSAEAVQAQMRSVQKSWADRGVEVSESVRSAERSLMDLESSRTLEFGKPLGRRAELLKSEAERERSLEERRAENERVTFRDYLSLRRNADMGSGQARVRIEDSYADRWMGAEQGLGSGGGGDLSWVDKFSDDLKGWVGKAVRTYNRFSGITGLPRIPTSANEFVMELRRRYNGWRQELKTTFGLAAVKGWTMDDMSKFMYEFNVQKGLFPSLSAEIDRTAMTLSRAFPLMGDNQLLRLVGDVRRTAFVLGESMEVVGRDVADLGRMTGESGDDILAAFLDLHSFGAAFNAEAGNPTISMESLRQSFVGVLKDSYRFNLSTEEALFVTKSYANMLDRGIITSEDLVRYITGLRTTNMGAKSTVAFEVVDRLEGRKEYRELVEAFRPYYQAGDQMSLERMVEVILTGSTISAREEFNMGEDQVSLLRRQLVSAIREVVQDFVKQYGGQDEMARYYVENQIFREWGVMTEGTPDQEEAARRFRLENDQIKAGLSDDSRAKVDTAMMAQESIFKQAAGLTNAKFIGLANDIKDFLMKFKMPDLEGLRDLQGTMTTMFYTSNWSAQFATDGGGKAAATLGYPGSGGRTPSGKFVDRFPEKDQKFLSDIDASIDKWCDFFNVNPALARGIMVPESGLSPTAVSRAGAQGLMQIMPDTAVGLMKDLVRMGVLPEDHPYLSLRGEALRSALRKNIDFNIMLGVFHLAQGMNVMVPKMKEMGFSEDVMLDWIIGSFNFGYHKTISPRVNPRTLTDKEAPWYIDRVKDQMFRFMKEAGVQPQAVPGDQSKVDPGLDKQAVVGGIYRITVMAASGEEADDMVDAIVLNSGIRGLEKMGAVRVMEGDRA